MKNITLKLYRLRVTQDKAPQNKDLLHNNNNNNDNCLDNSRTTNEMTKKKKRKLWGTQQIQITVTATHTAPTIEKSRKPDYLPVPITLFDTLTVPQFFS